MENIYKLQNGTDIRGVAYKNQEKEITLSEKEVELISKGFYTWVLSKKNKVKAKISIGMDSRITGGKFKEVVKNSIKALGGEIVDCNMATTPAMFMSTIIDDYKCDGAIMITASHMPYFYNGMKFFTSEGGLNKDDIKEILDLVVSGKFVDKQEGSCFIANLIDDYANILVEEIKLGAGNDRPFENMKIIVDAGNGAGGFFAEKVLKVLGANIEGSQFLNPDGMFPNHIPNPENKEAMESICSAVLESKADLGIIFDTDVDRAAIVDRNGKSINKNALIALISAIILEENPNTTIVTDSVTSTGLTKFIENIGGKHHRFKRGYKNVINESIRLNREGEESHLAIETSGHAAIKENYFLDDGAYLIAKILMKVAKLNQQGKTVDSLIEDLKQAKEDSEYRIGINVEEFKPYAQEILQKMELLVEKQNLWSLEKPNFEGVRVNCNAEDEKGWFLIRMSLHEPLLAINIESDVQNGCEKIYAKISKFLKQFDLNL